MPCKSMAHHCGGQRRKARQRNSTGEQRKAGDTHSLDVNRKGRAGRCVATAGLGGTWHSLAQRGKSGAGPGTDMRGGGTAEHRADVLWTAKEQHGKAQNGKAAARL